MKLSLQSRLILCFAGVVGLSVLLILFLMHRFLDARIESDIAIRLASAQHVLTVLHRAHADEMIARFEDFAGEPRMKAYGTIDDTATLERATRDLAAELGCTAVALLSRQGKLLAWQGPGRDAVMKQLPDMLQAGGEDPRYDMARVGDVDLEMVRVPIVVDGSVEAMLLAGREAGRNALGTLSAGAGTAGGLVYSDEIVLTSGALITPAEHLATVDVAAFTTYRYRLFLDTREITGPPAAVFRNILIVGLLSVIVSVAIAVAVARWVSGPVQDLAGTADAISGGAIDVRAPVAGAPEVRRLSEAFNRMLDRLLLVQSSLRQNTRELELEIERREALEDQLAHSQKMEAVGLLAGGIAHDFNNILTIVLAHCQLLLETLPKAASDRDMVVEITKAANRATALTRQLLVISRRESRDKSIFDLNKVVANMETLLRGPLGEQITLTTQCEADLPAVEADEPQLEQVILNLAVNARDAMPEGGTLAITTRTVDVTDDSSSGGVPLAPGKYCVLSVRDSGCGMSRETISRMFEPFFTTKQKGKGTGLGLATVYGVIRQSKGDIRVESTLGTGTCFEILLPAVAEAPADVSISEFPATMTIGSGTILVVEDDQEVAALITKVLERHGYNVIPATTISAAKSLVSRQGRSLDLLLCDVVLPDGNGPELAEGLKIDHGELKVVFMSGHDPTSCRGTESTSIRRILCRSLFRRRRCSNGSARRSPRDTSDTAYSGVTQQMPQRNSHRDRVISYAPGLARASLRSIACPPTHPAQSSGPSSAEPRAASPPVRVPSPRKRGRETRPASKCLTRGP